MTRWANSGNATAADQPSIGLVTLCDLDFASGMLHVSDGFGTVTFGGNDYLGVGQFGSVDAVVEALDATAKSVQLTLSGVDSNYISSAMTEDYQGRTVTLYVGIFDVNTTAWAANPEVVWEGRMDYMSIDVAQNASTIKLYCESRLFREPKVARYTDQDQQLSYAGDNFFNLLWQIPLATANWGSTDVTHPVTVRPHRNPNPWTNVGPGHNPGLNFR